MARYKGKIDWDLFVMLRAEPASWIEKWTMKKPHVDNIVFADKEGNEYLITRNKTADSRDGTADSRDMPERA